MALYEYRCPDCKEITEHNHSMNDKPNILCKTCGDSLVKVVGLGGVHYKGFGWYSTDSRTITRASDVHGR